MIPGDWAKQNLIGSNRSRQALRCAPSRLFVERFARPENNGVLATFRALFPITPGNQVWRELRSRRFKVVDYEVSPALASLLAPRGQHLEIRRHADRELFCVRSERGFHEWAHGRLPVRKNIRIDKIETI